MTGRGRPPTPESVKRLRGTASKRARGESPKPERRAPKCPDWLLPDAKTKWRALAPRLEALGLLTEADGEVFAVFCQAWARWRKAEKALARRGEVTVASRSGYLMPRPEVAIAKSQEEIVLKAASALGLSPSSRGRITVAPEAPQDRLGEYLDRGRRGSA